MTENEYNDIEKISRDYVDNFSFKQMILDDVMPKYFEEETSNLNIGLTGMVTDIAGQITEDGFNTASTLLLETFPTRAKMENSIYSNAAIFQLSNVFSDAARCEFLLVLSEEDVIKNFIHEQGSPYRYFYIDKNTTIYIEDIPFVLDYDIVIRAIYRETQGGWIYSAKYDMNEYTNSISPIKDPYIKIRKSSTGLLALQVNMGQYVRKERYESIIDNASINYPTVVIPYNDKICGIDVLYKKPTETEFKTQLSLQVRFSQPSKNPFCYYRKIDDERVELSFTTKDAYFQPEFNSELMIVTYTSIGADGNFDMYNGENFSLLKRNDKYQYDYSWAITAKSLSASAGGKDALSMDGLQSLTVEGFATANALTTEHDLSIYFNNYKYRYGAEVLFLKKRNDNAELLFSAFLYVKKDDYFYPTNTLTLDTNILYFDEKEGGFYNMDPGFLFSYKTRDIYRVLPIYYITDGDGSYYDKDGKLHDKDGNLQEESLTEEEITKKLKSGDLTQNPNQYYILVNDYFVLYNEDGTKARLIYRNPFDRSYYQLKQGGFYHYDERNELIEETSFTHQQISDMVTNKEIVKEVDDLYNDAFILTEDELYLKFREKGLTYDIQEIGNGKYIDYVRDSERELELRYDYLEYYETYRKNNKGLKYIDTRDNTSYIWVEDTFVHYDSLGRELPNQTKTEEEINEMVLDGYLKEDFMTMSEYMFNFTFKDYKKFIGADTRLKVFDPDIQEIAKKYKFLFTNPFLMSITKSSGLIGYYMTAVSQDCVLDFIKQNDADAFTQFITYTLHMNRDMSDEKRYHFDVVLLPSVSLESDVGMIDESTIYNPEDDTQFYPGELAEGLANDLLTYDKKLLNKNHVRVILTFYDIDEEQVQGYMELIPTHHDKKTDQITFSGEFITDDYVTVDNLFRVTHQCPYCGHEILNSVNTEKGNFKLTYHCEHCNREFTEGIINVNEIDDVWLPVTDALVHVNVIYKDPIYEDPESKEYGKIPPTNNEFVQYNPDYEQFHWTNVYASVMEPLTFIQPMNLLRSTIQYRDYYQPGIDALDCYIYDIPFVKYSTIAYRNEGPEITDTLEADDVKKFDYFLKSYTNHYRILNEAKLYLRNNTNIDTKFYNTYGRSTNFVIGENGELIDTVNIRIAFNVWLITNTDPTFAEANLKTFIKEYIESINNEGTNDLYISNLIRAIENNFAYVHHLVFIGINDYDVSYQAIKNKAIKLTDLSKEERRHFVPELITVNRANINLKFFEAT